MSVYVVITGVLSMDRNHPTFEAVGPFSDKDSAEQWLHARSQYEIYEDHHIVSDDTVASPEEAARALAESFDEDLTT